MNHEEFKNFFKMQVLRCEKILDKKAVEYTDGIDRMMNFNQAAGMNNVKPEHALWGMLAKHLISLTVMVIRPYSYNRKIWREKLGDALNYLFLLSAMVEERFENGQDIK